MKRPPLVISLGSEPGEPKAKPKAPSRASAFARGLMRAVKDGDEEALSRIVEAAGLFETDPRGE